MKTLTRPVSLIPQAPNPFGGVATIDGNSFDLEDSDDVMNIVRELINGSHPGLLSTVAVDGRPQCRWMASLSSEDFPVLHALTAPDCRKVGEIEKNPLVNWMFFNQDLSLIISMSGHARILRDLPTLKRVWKQIKDKSLAYFLKTYSKPPGFVVIETRVESIECTSPKNSLCFPVSLDYMGSMKSSATRIPGIKSSGNRLD